MCVVRQLIPLGPAVRLRCWPRYRTRWLFFKAWASWHCLVIQRAHQENAPVAVLNTRSLPFRVITPLFRVHFHLFFVCETYVARQSA